MYKHQTATMRTGKIEYYLLICRRQTQRRVPDLSSNPHPVPHHLRHIRLNSYRSHLSTRDSAELPRLRFFDGKGYCKGQSKPYKKKSQEQTKGSNAPCRLVVATSPRRVIASRPIGMLLLTHFFVVLHFGPRKMTQNYSSTKSL